MATAVADTRAVATEGDDAAPLRVEGLSKRWAGQPAPVLDNVNLSVSAGEAVGISGANGAGKTTLLRIITGILAPDAGAVTVCGRSLGRRRAAFQRAIGFLSAGNAGLYARLSPRQHLALWADLAFLAPGRGRVAIERAIERFDLGALCDRRTDRLSMGQRQRLRLAMTFLHEPRLVLLDEPLTSLDDAGAQILAAVADEHRARGGALVWASPGGAHGAGEFDRRLALVEGRLEAVA